ncbi:MAG: outer membrane lipoprotein chaperone LolA [Acidobacteriota bacterium]
MRTFLVLSLAAFSAAAVSARQDAPPDAAMLASRVQAHYTTVRDFTADFTLTQTSAMLPKPVEERGDVKIKKPSRMRWTYSTSNKQQFVSDGTRLYSYFPQDRYATTTALPKGNEVSTALLFLAGRGDLTRDFVASVPDQQPSGEWRLLLKPKATQADFKTLTLDVDRATLALRGFTVVDDQGAISRFRFLNLRENRGLTDKEFEFTIPKGVDLR